MSIESEIFAKYEADPAALEGYGFVREGDALEVLTPGQASFAVIARDLRDDAGAPVAWAQVPARRYSMDCGRALRPGDILRLRIKGAP